MFKNFFEAEERLLQLPEKKRIGVVAAGDRHTLGAVAVAVKEELIEAVLLGKKKEILSLLQEFDCPASSIEIIDIEEPEDCAKQAAHLVREGELDSLMKGKIETAILMRVLLNQETGIRKNSIMSQVTFADSPYYHKVFSSTDGALTPYPTLEQKLLIVNNAVEAHHALGQEMPKVAILTAVEQVNPKMIETVDAAALKESWQKGEISKCLLEGPISYDLAMQKEALSIKGFNSPVAGDADILVVPSVVAGNLLIKALAYTGGVELAGVTVGGMVPLIMTSRSSPERDKYMSIIFSSLIGKAG